MRSLRPSVRMKIGLKQTKSPWGLGYTSAKLHDPAVICFESISACDGQIDGHAACAYGRDKNSEAATTTE